MKVLKILGHQGDVPIFEVDEFPADLKTDKQCEEKTLAYGEVTGHSHYFEDVETVEVFKANDAEFNGLCFFEVSKDNTLIHGRARNFTGTEPDTLYHNPISLKPGRKYMTGIFPDTDWSMKTVRKVID